MIKKLVIAYGTLKAKYSNHGCIAHESTKFLGEIETPPIYTLYSGGYPIVERDGNTAIKGELYEVNDKRVLERVYNLEGYSGTPGDHNHFYDVDIIDTPYGKAEIFVMNKGVSGREQIVESGVWEQKSRLY